MKIGLVVLVGAAWIGCGPFLARFMGKRGYDPISWLAVGSLIGPAALAITLMERLWWTQLPPEIVIRGASAGGSINVLVLIDDVVDVTAVARPLIEWFGSCLGRLVIARIVPEDGPLEEQDRVTGDIEEAVGRMEPYSAEGMLLFGRTESAVATTVRNARFHVVITARPDAAVREAIARTEAVYVDGPQYAAALPPTEPSRDGRLQPVRSSSPRRRARPSDAGRAPG